MSYSTRKLKRLGKRKKGGSVLQTDKNQGKPCRGLRESRNRARCSLSSPAGRSPALGGTISTDASCWAPLKGPAGEKLTPTSSSCKTRCSPTPTRGPIVQVFLERPLRACSVSETGKHQRSRKYWGSRLQRQQKPLLRQESQFIILKMLNLV